MQKEKDVDEDNTIISAMSSLIGYLKHETISINNSGEGGGMIIIYFNMEIIKKYSKVALLKNVMKNRF